VTKNRVRSPSPSSHMQLPPLGPSHTNAAAGIPTPTPGANMNSTATNNNANVRRSLNSRGLRQGSNSMAAAGFSGGGGAAGGVGHNGLTRLVLNHNPLGPQVGCWYLQLGLRYCAIYKDFHAWDTDPHTHDGSRAVTPPPASCYHCLNAGCTGTGYPHPCRHSKPDRD
jgi:hypothetical protein